MLTILYDDDFTEPGANQDNMIANQFKDIDQNKVKHQESFASDFVGRSYKFWRLQEIPRA